MKASHHHVQSAIKCERDYQDDKWGTIEKHPHDVGAWITILRKKIRDAEEKWCLNSGHERALNEILKVTAVGFACLQQHGIVTREIS